MPAAAVEAAEGEEVLGRAVDDRVVADVAEEHELVMVQWVWAGGQRAERGRSSAIGVGVRHTVMDCQGGKGGKGGSSVLLPSNSARALLHSTANPPVGEERVERRVEREERAMGVEGEVRGSHVRARVVVGNSTGEGVRCGRRSWMRRSRHLCSWGRRRENSPNHSWAARQRARERQRQRQRPIQNKAVHPQPPPTAAVHAVVIATTAMRIIRIAIVTVLRRRGHWRGAGPWATFWIPWMCYAMRRTIRSGCRS